MKYKAVYASLDPDEIYAPSSVAQFGIEKGIVPVGKNTRKAYTRLRISAGSFARNHFPPQGDGFITTKCSKTVPGYFGYRWIDAAEKPQAK